MQRAGHARLVEGHLGPGRAHRLQLRGDGPEPPVPCVGRAVQAPRCPARAPVRPSPLDVRPGPDHHPVRPEQHRLRGRGRRGEQGQTRPQQGVPQRLPAADAGDRAGRQRLRAARAVLCREFQHFGQRAHHAARHVHRAGCGPGCNGGDGCGHRLRGQSPMAARAGFARRGRVQAARAPVRPGAGHRGAVGRPR